MPTATRDTPLAKTYARSLLELANEKQHAEAVAQELRDLSEVLESNQTFHALVSDPGVSTASRRELLDKVFNGRVSPLVMNFMRVVNEKGRLGLLPQIQSAYDEQLGEQLGNVEVDVTVAQKLTADQLEQVRQRVSQALGRNAVVHQYVDESIIGGLIVRVQDRLLDASVRSQLQALKEQLLSAKPRQN